MKPKKHNLKFSDMIIKSVQAKKNGKWQELKDGVDYYWTEDIINIMVKTANEYVKKSKKDNSNLRIYYYRTPKELDNILEKPKQKK